MSRNWWVIFSIVVVIGIISLVTGFTLPKLDSFLQSFLASLAASMFILAIVIYIIEGPNMTRERRLQKVVSKVSYKVAQINEEIAVMVSREIGQFLVSNLNSNIDLYGEERGDWKAFKALLREIFRESIEVPTKGLPQNLSISKEDYLMCLDGPASLSKRVRDALGSNWEVQAQLLELVEHLDKLDTRILEANYASTISDEKMRYRALGQIGNALIDLIESCPKLKD
jgi:hypothetical protein